MPKFGTKIALFVCFWQNMPYLGFFGIKFSNISWHIWTQHPQSCLFPKCLNLRSNVLYLGSFGLEFKNKYCHIWNHHPQIGQKWVFNSYSEL